MLQMVDAAEPGHLAWWVCDESLQREVLAGVTAAVCADAEDHCSGWAAAGECSTNRAFMLDKCGWLQANPASGSCVPLHSKHAAMRFPVAVHITHLSHSDFTRFLFAIAHGCADAAPPITAPPDACGPCAQYRCKKSCDACSLTAATAKAVATAPCLDSDPGCPGWADGGECERNPVFMHRACPLSCKQCHKQDVSSL